MAAGTWALPLAALAEGPEVVAVAKQWNVHLHP